MSFLKQLPPNPGPGFKKYSPILLSFPTANATSFVLDPVASHIAVTEFIELTLWARKALAINFDNSALHKLVVIIF